MSHGTTIRSTRLGRAARGIVSGSWLLASAVGSPMVGQGVGVGVATVTLRSG